MAAIVGSLHEPPIGKHVNLPQHVTVYKVLCQKPLSARDCHGIV